MTMPARPTAYHGTRGDRCLEGGPRLDKRLYRIPEVMELTSLSRSELYRSIARGELAVTHVGRAVRVAAEDLDEFVQAKRRETRDREAVPA